jgi:dienelactone hydrolase
LLADIAWRANSEGSIRSSGGGRRAAGEWLLLGGRVSSQILLCVFAAEEVRVMGRFLCYVLTFLFCTLTFGVSTWSVERAVDLTAADGTKLKATYFAAPKPGPGVLLLHQCNRQRKIWDGLAQQLSAAGINVLTLDYRGYGESGGDRFDKLPPQEAAQIQTEKWPGDIDTAFQYLVSQPGVTRETIGVGGASCGVNNSIQTARRHTEVKSLVLLSGNTDLKGRQFLRESTKLPVFFAVADDDEFPPSIVAIEWLYSLAADPEKKFVHVATGGHGADMFKVHPDMPGTIVDWYVTTLIKTPGRASTSKEKLAVPKEVQVLDEIDQPGGTAKVAKKLEEARQHDPKAKLFPEDIVNFVGYEHLQAGDNKGAIEILKLNAEGYPNSPNVYDSLSDAYFADGQRDLARENAKKALELLPSDTTDPEDRRNGIKASAEQKLKQLGEAQ